MRKEKEVLKDLDEILNEELNKKIEFRKAAFCFKKWKTEIKCRGCGEITETIHKHKPKRLIEFSPCCGSRNFSYIREKL